jgi:RNA polymerase sigma factor (sigma-70 family)
MNEKEIRQWYEANGLEYLPEDWGDRADNGESLGYQPLERDRIGHERVSIGFDEKKLEALEEFGQVMLLWEQREDHEVLEAIEEFFTPYLASMPQAKRRVIDDYMYGRRTQQQIATALGVSQQAVSKQLAAALRWVIARIASDERLKFDDDEDSSLIQDEELAWVAFNAFWERRFGTPWPLRG